MFSVKLAPTHSLVGTGKSRFQNPIGSLPSTLVYFSSNIIVEIIQVEIW